MTNTFKLILKDVTGFTIYESNEASMTHLKTEIEWITNKCNPEKLGLNIIVVPIKEPRERREDLLKKLTPMIDVNLDDLDKFKI